MAMHAPEVDLNQQIEFQGHNRALQITHHEICRISPFDNHCRDRSETRISILVSRRRPPSAVDDPSRREVLLLRVRRRR
jgi:hypothetical protein